MSEEIRPAPAAVTDHGALTGLADDDHGAVYSLLAHSHAATNSAKASGSGDVTTTASLADVTGATLSLVAGTYIVVGVFDVLVNNALNDRTFEGHLDVGAVDENDYVQLNAPGLVNVRATLPQIWRVVLGSTTTVKLRTLHSGGTVGDFTVKSTNTTISAWVAGGEIDHVPVGTGALTTTEGYIGWQSTNEMLRLYDGQRERGIGHVGWATIAYPVNFTLASALTTAVALAANGGSVAVPMLVSAHFLLQAVTVRSTDTATARTWGWDLYLQDLNDGNAGENTARRVAASTADESFTPGAASTRTIDAGSAPVYLAPGIYWLVVQCRHASNNFGLASTATGHAFGPDGPAQTKTTTNPNGATLDLVAATWTKNRSHFGVWLRGRVLGQTVQY